MTGGVCGQILRLEDLIGDDHDWCHVLDPRTQEPFCGSKTRRPGTHLADGSEAARVCKGCGRDRCPDCADGWRIWARSRSPKS